MINRKRILVADDDPAILDAIKIMLEEIGGYEVITTEDGHSVLEMERDDLPDLLLLDLWMSGINGKKICQTLKGNVTTRNLPIIIFSANRDIHDIATSAGADDYISKPFNMRDLLEKVRKIIEG